MPNIPHYSGDFELRPAILVRKGPRQSRDLAEYVAIAYLNILKLEVVAELELLKVGLHSREIDDLYNEKSWKNRFEDHLKRPGVPAAGIVVRENTEHARACVWPSGVADAAPRDRKDPEQANTFSGSGAG